MDAQTLEADAVTPSQSALAGRAGGSSPRSILTNATLYVAPSFCGWTTNCTLCKVWNMSTGSLQPTLWRTCRILASDTRLRILAQLHLKQPQSVSELAEQCALTMPVASQSLRALEARGLLKVKRIRRRVEYSIPARSEAGTLANLINELQAALRREPLPTVTIRKLATAFTHPSRIQIYRVLQSGPKTQAQIQCDVRLSASALSRHLAKLEKRGYVHFDGMGGGYGYCRHPDPIGRALSNLALG